MTTLTCEQIVNKSQLSSGLGVGAGVGLGVGGYSDRSTHIAQALVSIIQRTTGVGGIGVGGIGVG
jgi:hypothetical protein